MNKRFSLCLAVTATFLAVTLSSPAASAADNSTTASLAPKLAGTNATAAWAELTEATHPPTSPKEWETKPPTDKEKQQFYLPFVQALVGKTRDFYTRFPKDENASGAKMMEFNFTSLLMQWGVEKEDAVIALAKTLMADSSLGDKEHVFVVQMTARSGSPEKLRPLLEDIVKNSTSEKVKTAAEGQLAQIKAVGQPVDIQFTAVDGRSVDLSKLKGKVVLIDFWATWCPPCRGEVPTVKKTYDSYHEKGFEIVGISLDKEKDKLTEYVAENKMAWPQFFDGKYWENKYAVQFGIQSIPAMWLVDKKGNLRTMNAREDLAGEVQKLLAE